jgi:hypothetical protein
MTLAVNFASGATGVVDTGGKFATSVNDTGEKSGINNTGGKFATVSDELHLKVTLKEKKFIFLLTQLPKGVQTK